MSIRSGRTLALFMALAGATLVVACGDLSKRYPGLPNHFGGGSAVSASFASSAASGGAGGATTSSTSASTSGGGTGGMSASSAASMSATSSSGGCAVMSNGCSQCLNQHCVALETACTQDPSCTPVYTGFDACLCAGQTPVKKPAAIAQCEVDLTNSSTAGQNLSDCYVQSCAGQCNL